MLLVLNGVLESNGEFVTLCITEGDPTGVPEELELKLGVNEPMSELDGIGDTEINGVGVLF